MSWQHMGHNQGRGEQQLKNNADSAEIELDTLRKSLAEVTAERDEIITTAHNRGIKDELEIDDLKAERNKYIVARDHFQSLMQEINTERDRLRAERAKLKRERKHWKNLAESMYRKYDPHGTMPLPQDAKHGVKALEASDDIRD